MSKIAFVVGSPRSGTTILGNILNCHTEIAVWYEPYYIWEKHFTCEECDVWDIEDLNIKVKNNIRNEYNAFQKKTKKNITLSKIPLLGFNIPIIHSIFPDAKWVHIVRDGRDVTLSIRKEWAKRKEIVEQKKFLRYFQSAWEIMQKQPSLKYKVKAVLFELKSYSLSNPSKYLNRPKWKGQIGWGPRFRGWKEYLQTHSILEFNAMQWSNCVETIRKNWSILSEKDKIEIKYEDLVNVPQETLKKILEVLEVEITPLFFRSIPKLMVNNTHKWEKEFTPQEIKQLKAILNPWLGKMGYVDKVETW